MTKTTPQVAALALSALVTLGIVAGANGLANTQYAAAERLAFASDAASQVAVQRVIVIGHRANA
jgi:hypothetical protein